MSGLSKMVVIEGKQYWQLDSWAFDVAVSIRNAKNLDEAAQMCRNIANNIRTQCESVSVQRQDLNTNDNKEAL